MNDKGFNMEFELNGISYIAYVMHTLELTPDQFEKYDIKENSFLVHLFSAKGFNSFELFHREDPLAWETDSSAIIVDAEIPQIIGDRIDSLHM